MKTNKIPSTVFSCLVAGLLLAATAAPAAAQTPAPARLRITQVDTSAFPQVKVYVSAVNDAGDPVPVHADQIRLAEDGQVLQPKEAHGIGNSEPLSVLLVVDVSGSMLSAGKMDAAKAAASALIRQMTAGEEGGLLTFNTQISYVQPLTADHDTLLAATDRLRAERYNTAMYDALARAEEILQPVSGRKSVIVLTDGVDNQSTNNEGTVLQKLGASGLTISTIGLGEPAQGRATEAGLDESALQDLADQSGGSYSYVNDANALRALYERLGKTLQSEYVITYTSPARYRDGVSRSLTVSLGSAAAGSAAQAAYNPGGLIPEVPQASSWPLFLVLIAALVCMVFVPTGVRWAFASLSAIRAPGMPQAAANPKIRLKEATPTRIKILK
jgi:VWFA-related protein